MNLRAWTTLGLCCVGGAAVAKPTRSTSEQTVATVSVPRAKGAAIKVWVTRKADSDGGVVVKLVAEGVADRPQALTIYTGGGADDGAGDSEVKEIAVKAFALPNGAPAVRVDLSYRIPDGRNRDEQTDTFLVGLDGKTRKLLELPTRRMRDQSKTCREGTATQLALRAGAGGAIELLAGTTAAVNPVLGDDDLPVDKTCKAATGTTRVLFRMKGEKFEQINPPPKAQPAAAPVESDD